MAKLKNAKVLSPELTALRLRRRAHHAPPFRREFDCSPSDFQGGNDTTPLLGPIGTELKHWFLKL